MQSGETPFMYSTKSNDYAKKKETKSIRRLVAGIRTAARSRDSAHRDHVIGTPAPPTANLLPSTVKHTTKVSLVICKKTEDK